MLLTFGALDSIKYEVSLAFELDDVTLLELEDVQICVRADDELRLRCLDGLDGVLFLELAFLNEVIVVEERSLDQRILWSRLREPGDLFLGRLEVTSEMQVHFDVGYVTSC